MQAAHCPFFKALFMQECYFYKSLPLPPNPYTHKHYFPLFPFHYPEHLFKNTHGEWINGESGDRCVDFQQTRNKTEEKRQQNERGKERKKVEMAVGAIETCRFL